MGSKALSVPEFTGLLLRKYQKGEFADGKQENLARAAEELYLLLRKLKGATGDKSDDLKAPLKAVRAAIDEASVQSAHPASELSPRAEALFSLLDALERLCEERAELGGSEGDAAAALQGLLRYRLQRLVTGDAWDSKPALKLRALQVMFEAMVRENTALRSKEPQAYGEEGRPELRLSRSRSFGSKGRGGSGGGGGGGAAQPQHSKWQDSINELSKMQGIRLLPLMKLLLADNFKLQSGPAHAHAHAHANAPEAAAGAAPVPRAAAPPTTPEQARPPRSPPSRQLSGSNPVVDDLLGLNEGLESAPSMGWLSTASSAPTDDPFAALAEVRMPPPAPAALPPAPQQAFAAFPGPQPAPPAPLEGLGSQFGGMSISVPGAQAGSLYSGREQHTAASLGFSAGGAYNGNQASAPINFGPPSAGAPTQGGYQMPYQPMSPPSGAGPYQAGPQSSPYLPQSPPFGGRGLAGGLGGGPGMPYLPQSPHGLPPGFAALPRPAPAFQPTGSPSTPGNMHLGPAMGSYNGIAGIGGSPLLQAGSGGGAMAFPLGPMGSNTTWAASAGEPQRSASLPLSLGDSSGTHSAAGSERGAPADGPQDNSSPYVGKNNPFLDTRFEELAPSLAAPPPPAPKARRPPPPPPTSSNGGARSSSRGDGAK